MSSPGICTTYMYLFTYFHLLHLFIFCLCLSLHWFSFNKPIFTHSACIHLLHLFPPISHISLWFPYFYVSPISTFLTYSQLHQLFLPAPPISICSTYFHPPSPTRPLDSRSNTKGRTRGNFIIFKYFVEPELLDRRNNEEGKNRHKIGLAITVRSNPN